MTLKRRLVKGGSAADVRRRNRHARLYEQLDGFQVARPRRIVKGGVLIPIAAAHRRGKQDQQHQKAHTKAPK